MDELLAKIDAYRRRWLIEETAFGRLFVNDPNIIKEMRDGTRQFRLRTIAEIERLLAMTPAEVSAEVGRPVPPGPDVALTLGEGAAAE